MENKGNNSQTKVPFNRCGNELLRVELPDQLDVSQKSPFIFSTKFTLGRDSSCDVKLQGNVVSHRHAEIFFDGVTWCIREKWGQTRIKVNFLLYFNRLFTCSRKMARLPRYFVKGQPQHIIQRGNNRGLIFVHNDDYRFYLECLQSAINKNKLWVHCYVLMTNHVHILASPETETSISKTLQSVGRRYVQYFNYTYNRTGTLWEGRYKATVIDSDQYLLTCMRYIELNPVRAGMVELPSEYPWSSYAANAEGENNKIIKSHEVYRQMGVNEGERQLAYRQLFRYAIGKLDLDALREATNKGWVLGSDRFRKEIERLSGRRSAAKLRGRPKKVND